METRVDRDIVYSRMAQLMSERSTCERGHVGCVFTRDNRVVCTGYNGAPAGMPHCTTEGCEVLTEGCERCLHAETAAISFAAKEGIILNGSILYVTHAPCYNCAKLLLNVGVIAVCFKEFYRDQRGLKLLFDQGVELAIYTGDRIKRVSDYGDLQ